MNQIDLIHPENTWRKFSDELGISNIVWRKRSARHPRRITRSFTGRRSITADTALRIGTGSWDDT